MIRNGNGDGAKAPYPDLGPCCVCETTAGVRNVIPLDQKSPILGHGWGCFVCGLPANGATAVTCDACLEKPLKFACRGYPGKEGRIPVEELTGEHHHDYRKHPEMWWFTDSPDAGDPECICSVCRQRIKEEDNPLRMWEGKGEDTIEARLHGHCYEEVQHLFK